MRRQVALQAEERARRDAAEEATQRSAFLATVSESLTRSQSHAELLRSLVTLPIPPLADVAIAWLKDNETCLDLTEWHRATLDDGDLPDFKLSDFPWLQERVDEVFTTKQFQHLTKVPMSQAAPVALGAWDFVLALPLSIQGQTCGVLILALLHSGRSYQVKDISLANDLAHRAELALERVMLVERIRQADRRKDEFLGMLAHELRNPLGPIYNCLQLQKKLDPKDPRLANMHDIIDRQTRQMGRLIDDLLDATRLAHGKILLRKERCDLTKIIRHTVEDYRNVINNSGLKLKVHSPEKILWVDGDPTRLVQIVGNLLHNAHKFSKPGGGTITVRLETENNGSTAAIIVSDTGIGIEPGMIRYIFDAFRQADQGLDRSRGGLGLGLALVKGLSELHGGTVQGSSRGPNQGAEFVVRLPLAFAQDVSPSLGTGALVVGGKKYRILVIEDNRDAAESIQMLLQLEGHEAKIALTAESGLKMARDFCPQVIFCDIGLPVMDGYQVVQTIRKDAALSSMYVIALTGYGREQDQCQALDAGFNLHLTKPVDFGALCRALAQAPHLGQVK